mmetsp:Transcript_4984/g.10741  ORF Transcript_4984/g.10741 Transcript_4984/m.10741 type:complete len:545 (-) Transcript_4984:985-2619(-)|eukprot:CAMPEP_0202912274 /NCGR_PEP_ID=MMETSP1392-20130828/57291_1 /ASSEMBLY_ACC=CAM_ASM_000868 /TAXON_ID=225041 /ORGANISM="Chlamydomonas chlamydogama, Strain SAG 11-48b" /LENGTH=544 /DNA_ID=CAMNT_0049603117 /DNA_START=144 /DNA_END=1778 /DNA_ORIENTATION=+
MLRGAGRSGGNQNGLSRFDEAEAQEALLSLKQGPPNIRGLMFEKGARLSTLQAGLQQQSSRASDFPHDKVAIQEHDLSVERSSFLPDTHCSSLKHVPLAFQCSPFETANQSPMSMKGGTMSTPAAEAAAGKGAAHESMSSGAHDYNSECNTAVAEERYKEEEDACDVQEEDLLDFSAGPGNDKACQVWLPPISMDEWRSRCQARRFTSAKRTFTSAFTDQPDVAGTLGAANSGSLGPADRAWSEEGDAVAQCHSPGGLKKSRLIWTPDLHTRFVAAVNKLGVQNAVPKTILQMMGVQGMTRENVASHLQKYRLHLKRNGGVAPEVLEPAAAPQPTQQQHLQQQLRLRRTSSETGARASPVLQRSSTPSTHQAPAPQQPPEAPSHQARAMDCVIVASPGQRSIAAAAAAGAGHAMQEVLAASAPVATVGSVSSLKEALAQLTAVSSMNGSLREVVADRLVKQTSRQAELPSSGYGGAAQKGSGLQAMQDVSGHGNAFVLTPSGLLSYVPINMSSLQGGVLGQSIPISFGGSQALTVLANTAAVLQ